MPSVSQLMKVLSADVVTALADDNRDQVPDAGVLEEAISAAEGLVRASLARAGLPADQPFPPLLDDIVLTLAVERLFERRRDVLPGPWTDRAARARILLEQIADGRHPVPGLAAGVPRVESATIDEPPLHRLHTLEPL
jgi:phage gp36-like protein